MTILGSDWSGLLWLILFFAFVLPAMQGRFGARRGHWKERMEEMKERGEQRREEERAFRDQILSELRRHNAVMERQNALMTEALDRLDGKSSNASSSGPEI